MSDGFDRGSGGRFTKDSKEDKKKSSDPFESLLTNFLGQNKVNDESVGALKSLLSELSDDAELKDALQMSPKGVDFSTIYKAAKKLTTKISDHSKKEKFKDALKGIDKDKLPQLQDVIDAQKQMFSDYFGEVMSDVNVADTSVQGLQEEIVSGVNGLFDEMSDRIENQASSLQSLHGELESMNMDDETAEKRMKALMKLVDEDEGYKNLQGKIEGFVNGIYEKILPDPKLRGQMHLYSKVERISKVMNKTGLSSAKKKINKNSSEDDFIMHRKV